MHSVFVYGSLKQGFGNHRLLVDQAFVGAGIIAGSYKMMSFGGFPGVEETPDIATEIVMGELYQVSDECLTNLDRLEGNGHFYTRKLVPTVVNNSVQDAWVYFVPYREDSKPMEKKEILTEFYNGKAYCW